MTATMQRGPASANKVLEFVARESAPYLGTFPDKALDRSIQCPDAYPDIAQAWNVRALALFRRNDNAGAVASLNRAIELDPSVAQFWSYRSLAHLRAGDADTAVADATRALEIKADSSLAFFYRAEAHRALRQWAQARRDYDQAIKIAPKWSMYRHGRAQLSMAESRWVDAEADLASALALPALPDERVRQIINRATVAARRLLGVVSPLIDLDAAGSP